MASSQTFEFEKGRVFASGLFWQPLVGLEHAARLDEIDKIVVEQDFHLMVLCETSIPQVGFASIEDGLQPGMLSSAEVISSAVEREGLDRNLVCATQLDDGRWLYVAQREGIILHNGDMIGSEEEIRARMFEDMPADNDWHTIFAPAAWAIPGSVERTFADFLPRLDGAIDYKQLSKLTVAKPATISLRTHWPYAALIAVCIACMFGYSKWKQHKAHQVEMAIMEQQEQARRQAEALLLNAPHPWKASVPALRFAQACEAALTKAGNLWPGNFTFVGTTCSGKTLTVAWTKPEHGSIAYFQEIQPKAVLSDNGASATLQIPLVVSGGRDESVPDQKRRVLDMYKAAQLHDYKIDVKLPTEPQMAPIPIAAPANVHEWRELTWTATGAFLTPFDVLASLDGAGFRVDAIATSFKDGKIQWNMKGSQYVRP
jgi:hypothetical protein